MIKRDLSDLPTSLAPSDGDADGWWPDRHPRLGPILVDQWIAAQPDNALEVVIPADGKHRGSNAGKCLRAIAYDQTDTERSDPMTVADFWRMYLGSVVHEALQEALPKVMPGAMNEVPVSLVPIGAAGSMRIDIMDPVSMDSDGHIYETVEVKTINGFGYKMQATDFRGPPQGPRSSHMMQAAIGAVAAEAAGYQVAGARVVYLSLELLSPKLAEQVGLGGEEARFCAEWFVPIEQLRPLVEVEMGRWAELTEALGDDPTVIRRSMLDEIDPHGVPKYIEIVNPKTGAAVDEAGVGARAWLCNYCNHQSTCIRDFEKEKEAAS